VKSLRGSLAPLVVLLGCGQVLGIDEAHVDPSLLEPGQAGALDAAGAAGSSEAVPSLCESYCDAVVSSCSGAQAQYLNREACLATCPDFPEGASGDSQGNTVNCRLTYALKAPIEPYTYCTWAGPGGDGKCGSNCQGFCSVMMQTCTQKTTQKGADFFASESACLKTCAALPDVGDYSASNAMLQRGADHVQCRIYHVGAAVQGDPAIHCPHAMGQKLCLDPAAP